MADYISASEYSQSALSAALTSGMVEEYQHGQVRVRRGSVVSQVNAAARLEGLAARRANGGLLHLARPEDPVE